MCSSCSVLKLMLSSHKTKTIILCSFYLFHRNNTLIKLTQPLVVPVPLHDEAGVSICGLRAAVFERGPAAADLQTLRILHVRANSPLQRSISQVD